MWEKNKSMQNSLIGRKVLTGLVVGAVLAIFACMSPVLVSAQGAPPAAAPGSTHEQRLAQRKAERNVTLDQKSQQRLANTCANAQAKVRNTQQKTTQMLANRTATYQKVDAKLWVMIGKLKLAQKDTFSLEKQRAGLSERATAFQSTAQNYQQARDDLVVVNCKADPVGFMAFLDTARLYNVELRKQTTDIRTNIVNEIKPALTAHAADLQAKPVTEGN